MFPFTKSENEIRQAYVFVQIVTHSAIFDFWPQRRHALRATPHGERPLSVEAYERSTGKTAKDRQLEIWKQQGVEAPVLSSANGPSRYND